MSEVFLRQGSDESSEGEDEETPVGRDEMEEESFADFVNRVRDEKLEKKNAKNEPSCSKS